LSHSILIVAIKGFEISGRLSCGGKKVPTFFDTFASERWVSDLPLGMPILLRTVILKSNRVQSAIQKWTGQRLVSVEATSNRIGITTKPLSHPSFWSTPFDQIG